MKINPKSKEILNENYPLKEFEKEEKVKISYREKVPLDKVLKIKKDE